MLNMFIHLQRTRKKSFSLILDHFLDPLLMLENVLVSPDCAAAASTTGSGTARCAGCGAVVVIVVGLVLHVLAFDHSARHAINDPLVQISRLQS